MIPDTPTLPAEFTDAAAVRDLLSREGIDDATISARLLLGDTAPRVRAVIAKVDGTRRVRCRKALVLAYLRGAR